MFSYRVSFNVKELKPFDPRAYFFNRKALEENNIIYLGENFKEIVQNSSPCIAEDSQRYIASRIHMNNEKGTSGLELVEHFNHIYHDRKTFSPFSPLSVISYLIGLQRRAAEDGPLLQNGKTNIFLIPDYCIGVIWFTKDYRKWGWSIKAYPFVPKPGKEERLWFDGNQVIWRE